MRKIPALESIVSKTLSYPIVISQQFTDDPTEQSGAHYDSEYSVQDEESNENLTNERHDQATAEQQTDTSDPAAHVVDHFDEGESSNGADPEPADDDESTVGPLSGDERTEQPVGIVEYDREPDAVAVTDLDSYPEPLEDPVAVHEHPDDHNTPSVGENSTEYEEVVATNEDYESDYNENDQGGEHGETVAVEGDARDTAWTTTTPDAQHTQDDHDVGKADKREQIARVVPADDLTPPSADAYTIELTAPNPDDDHITGQQGK